MAQITITLSDAQVAAIGKLGFDDSKQVKFAQGVVSSQIKSRYKMYMENAKEAMAKLYDDAVALGAKFPIEKGVFINTQMIALQSILDDLNAKADDKECEPKAEEAAKS